MKTKYLTVDANDLKSLCEAVLENQVDRDNGGSWGSEREFCRFCGGSGVHDKYYNYTFKHDLNCPVLIAESVKPRE